MGKPSKVTEAVPGRVRGNPGWSIYCPAKQEPLGRAGQAYFTGAGGRLAAQPLGLLLRAVCLLTLSQVNERPPCLVISPPAVSSWGSNSLCTRTDPLHPLRGPLPEMRPCPVWVPLSLTTAFPAVITDVRVGPQRRLSTEELMLSNCGAGEAS